MTDLDWDEWMALSDEQQQAILDRKQAALQRLTDQIPRPRLYAHYRSSFLKSCLRQRRFIAEYEFEIFREQLKRCQVSLMRLRAWRATGYTQYPGEA